MIKNFRVSIVSFLIHINESIFFYPKLTKVYKKLFPNSTLSIAIDVGVNKGQTITEGMIIVKGPGGGLLPKYLNIVILIYLYLSKLKINYFF